MAKCTPDGHQIEQIAIHPSMDYEFIEGPYDDFVDCPVPGILVRVIPGSEDGHVEIWDGGNGENGEGTQMASLKLEQFMGAIEFNIEFNESLHLVLDDDAAVTVIHDHYTEI